MPVLSQLQAQFTSSHHVAPIIDITQHTLQQYNELMTPMEVCYG